MSSTQESITNLADCITEINKIAVPTDDSRYILGQYQEALADCEVALHLNPQDTTSVISAASEEAGGTPDLPASPPEAYSADFVPPAMTHNRMKLR